jgi:hypothetical protein
MPPSPLVSCTGCDRTWNSATMAEGLRVVGSCPRCGGGLTFADDAPEAGAPEARAVLGGESAPHLVLGVPRR